MDEKKTIELKRRLKLDTRPKIIVEYDYIKNREYVIHLYEFVGEGTEDVYTATWNWLYVDLIQEKLAQCLITNIIKDKEIA